MDIDHETKPVYATQGGGYAIFEGGRYVWHSEIPDFIFAHVGDPIPDEWGVVAVNQAARDEAAYELDRDLLVGDGPLGIGA